MAKIIDSNGNVFVRTGHVSDNITISGENVQVTADVDTGKPADGRMNNVISGHGNVVVEADSIHGNITFG